MKRKDIEKRLSSAVSQIIPKDGFERISEKLDSASIHNERTVIKMTENKRNLFKKYMRVAVAACLVIAVGLFSMVFYGNNIAVDSIVDLDVNPSIELATNKQDKVVKVTPVNDDAKAIIDGMDLKNTDLDVAVNAIIGSMVKNGYLDDIDNGILVTVQNEDENKASSLQKKIAVNIDEALKTHNVDAAVINQSVPADSGAEKLAESLGVSIGKAIFIQNLVSKEPSLKAEELAGMSIRDLAKVVNDKNIDISDIADYDADDSIWENIADSIEEVNEDAAENRNPADKVENSVQVSVPDGIISADDAKKVALAHAGVGAEKAFFEKTELDRDDGRYVYEIEFRVGTTEYEYEINAQNSVIIDFEKEQERNTDDKANQNKEPSSEAGSQAVAGEKISLQKAKEIALVHAGLSADQVSFYKAELDRDDGRYVYEIEFIYDNFDYEYEIDAVSGKITDSEKEKID